MAYWKWNWQKDGWPNFSYNQEALKRLEYQFMQANGIALGAFKHVQSDEKDELVIEILGNEALKTSEIEGEYLDRKSIQESIKQNLGLDSAKRKLPPAEFGISEMMVDLYQSYNKPLTHNRLFQWHSMLTNGRRDLVDIGRYRTHIDPMQVVSGRLDGQTVHYEAPPSYAMKKEMEAFVLWFNLLHVQKDDTMLPLARAGIVHFYFLAIHPFEDGNGRIARGLSQKSISMSIQHPVLISLSQTIESKKKDYYAFLEAHNRTLDLTKWLLYFGQTILDAQDNTLKIIEFLIEKARFFDRFSNQINERQAKAIKRIFNAGHLGFKGGLSAENYISIVKTSASTATRDLKDLVDKGILLRSGDLKSTRYWLALNKE